MTVQRDVRMILWKSVTVHLHVNDIIILDNVDITDINIAVITQQSALVHQYNDEL